MTRSSPRSALTSDDLPTLGRPTIAMSMGAMAARRSASARRSQAAVASPTTRSGPPGSPESSGAGTSPAGPSAASMVGPGSSTPWASANSTSSASSSSSASRRFLSRSSSLSGGSAHTRASSRSPVPRPWSARDGERVLPPVAMELRGVVLAPLAVRLVRGDHHRYACAPQELRRLLVGRRLARRGVDHEQDQVRLVDRQACLFLDLRLDRVARAAFEPAGVHDDEPASVPLGLAVQPVPRGPRTVLDDRGPLPDDAVEERALADVGSSDDRDDGQPSRRPRRWTGGHVQAAPGTAPDVTLLVRYVDAATRPRESAASSAACARASSVPASS